MATEKESGDGGSDAGQRRRRAARDHAAARAPTDATATSTTIGRYIARFRNEEPRPREERTRGARDDFWWTHRRPRAALEQHQSSSDQRDGAEDSECKAAVRDVDASSASGSSIGSSSQTGNRSRAERHAVRAHVSAPNERAATPVDSTDALLLSSASWSSLSSHLEPPSRSTSRGDSETPSLPSQSPRQRQSEEELSLALPTPPLPSPPPPPAVAVHLSTEHDIVDSSDNDDEPAPTLEDAELVIERVRKRLGWSSSSSSSSVSDATTAAPLYGALSPSLPWRYEGLESTTSSSSRFRLLPSPSPSSLLSPLPPLEWCEDEDEVLSATLGYRPTELASRSSSRDAVLDDTDVLDALRTRLSFQSDAVPSRALDAVAVATASHASLCAAPDDASGRRHKAGNPADAASRGLDDTDAEEKVETEQDTAVAAREIPVLVAPVTHHTQPDADHDALDAAVAVAQDATQVATQVASECVAESALAPATSLQQMEPAATLSSPPRSPVHTPVSSGGARSSRESSTSSVTAETAKALDGLVSLVVQSWSSDVLFGASASDSGDATQETEVDEEHTDEASVAAAQAAAADQSDVHDVSAASQALGRDVSEDEASVSDAESAGSTCCAAVAGPEHERTIDKDASRVDLDDGDGDDDDDDEIVRLLRARIALFEEALRRLESEQQQVVASR